MEKVTYKPILFNTPMVQAIDEGRKTHTRRLVKGFIEGQIPHSGHPHPDLFDLGMWEFLCGGQVYGGPADFYVNIKAPYKTGDILWVRETWTEDGQNFYYRADFESDWLDPCETLSCGYPIYCSYHPGCEGCMREKQRIHWRPSIHMPKEAARSFLKVVNVRAHRLIEISREDAIKEGANPAAAVENFIAIWNDTVKKEDLPRSGWDANPWVWVIGFEMKERDG